MKKHFLNLLAISIMIATTSHSQIISTIAGNGIKGYSGDGGSAITSELLSPMGLTVDISGNIYIADGCRIRKVSPNGIIKTIAGNGTAGYSGDGGIATSAELYYPLGLAIDAIGNLFIADQYNHRIRKVSPNGIITTVAGNGTFVHSGDGDSATSAGLIEPSGVAVDASGNLYIADYWDNRIRKVSNKGIISTVAGNGNGAGTYTGGYSGDGGIATAAELNVPEGVAVDASGNIYIADTWNNVIRKVSTNGIISTVAGNGFGAGINNGGYSGDGGIATAAELFEPWCIAVDAKDNLYIGDAVNGRIRKVNTSGIISTIAGNGLGGYTGDGGVATSAGLTTIFGLALDDKNNVYISDNKNYVIRKVTFNNLPVTISSFTASNFNNAIKTVWQTATELNTANFIIQQSTDGSSFTDIGTVKAIGSGANNYNFTDNSPVNGINYYRLQIIDKDGTTSYSKVISVPFSILNSPFSIYPNPATNFATIHFSKAVDKATISVYDITGKAVISQPLNGSIKDYKLNTQTLPNGLYVVKVNTETCSYNEKLLISK